MNVFLVYAHPEPCSFNGAMKNLAVETLTGAGHKVQVSDLYGMRFNPVADPSEFVSRSDRSHFRLQREQQHAALTGTLPADVTTELEKLMQAELIIFQFPLWWGSMPAILKGWIDRVFVYGTVYGPATVGLQGRKLLLSITASRCSAGQGCGERIKAELSHVIDNMCALSKLEVLEPEFCFGPESLGAPGRERVLHAYSERLSAIA